MKLLLIDFTPVLAREGEPQQTQSVRAGSRFAVGLERRLRCGNEKQPLQPQFLARRLRDQQMPEMHRVKGTAK